MRVALVSPPLLPVPPPRYGGVERVVGVLAEELHARGHDVTLFAPGDSEVGCRLVPTVPRSVWPTGFHPDPAEFYARTRAVVQDSAREFDLVHSHLDHHGFELARALPVPVVSTLHGRTDTDPLAAAIAKFHGIALVAISESQRGYAPDAAWLATVHHGLPLHATARGDGAGGYLLFVGRLSTDKGVAEAVETARQARRRLVVAAKALAPNEMEVYETVVRPAVKEGVVEFVGEVGPAERDRLYGGALATIMLSRWPEPFGLVAIESLAVGTPVIARRSGALPEIVLDGRDGFLVDSQAQAVAAIERLGDLDRDAIRARALDRFSVERMVDEYEDVYRRAIERSQHSHSAAL
jgi:glycosyltransferase involved in cell wall biosynthesis